jgi:hypothetical protein
VYALYGGLLLSTGVPDYEIGSRTQKDINRTAEQLKGDENSDELNRTIDALEKGAVFGKLVSRLFLFLGEPINLLVCTALVSSLLFLAVSLGGTTKADFAQLWGISVFSSFVEVPGLLVRLFLISQLHYSRVETSAAAFLVHPQSHPVVFLLLKRLDPFQIWFWALIGLGLYKTGQMSAGRSVVLVVFLGLLAAMCHGCGDLSSLVEIRGLIELAGKD